MKKYLLTGGFATALLLGACGNEEPEAEETTEEAQVGAEESTEEQAAETTEEEKTVEEESEKGSRTKPYQIGDTAEITISEYNDENEPVEGAANITFDNVVRGDEALTQINEQASGTHDEPDGENMEWMLFDFTFELVEFVDDNTQYTFATRFFVFNQNGESVKGPMASGVSDGDGNTLFPGGVSENSHAIAVPAGEPFLVSFGDAEGDVFFEVSEGSSTTQEEQSNEASAEYNTEESSEEPTQEESPEESTEEMVQKESQIDISNITDQSVLESIIYGNYSGVDKIEAYNSAVANGVIPQGTVTEGSAVAAYESSVGLQNGETESDQLAERYQTWVDEGIMTEEEMQTQLDKLE